MLAWIVIACGQGDQTFGAVKEVSGQDQGTAMMTIEPLEILFEDVEVGILSSGSITITSVGDGALSIDSVDITNSVDGAFYMDSSSAEDLSLEPGITREIVATITMQTAEIHIGEMRVRSNDEDNRDVRIPMCAFPLGYDGEIACPSDEEEDSGGK